MNQNQKIMVITGTSRGIGKYLVNYYSKKGFFIYGCSRGDIEYKVKNYTHFSTGVSEEKKVKEMFSKIRKIHGRIDILINNAGIASMNHILMTPTSTIKRILDTNVIGTFLFCREGAKLMRNSSAGRIINFATVATPLQLEGESIYASSKAAVESLTKILARELSDMNITVNAVGPTPVKTDLIKSVPEEKMNALISRQALKRYGEFADISNVIDFFINPNSSFVTGQVVFLGGI